MSADIIDFNEYRAKRQARNDRPRLTPTPVMHTDAGPVYFMPFDSSWFDTMAELERSGYIRKGWEDIARDFGFEPEDGPEAA